MNFKNGVKHGECKEWRKDGQIKMDEFYVEGKKQPPWQRSFAAASFTLSPSRWSSRSNTALLARFASLILLLQLLFRAPLPRHLLYLNLFSIARVTYAHNNNPSTLPTDFYT